jgi:hypothetical protein
MNVTRAGEQRGHPARLWKCRMLFDNDKVESRHFPNAL